VPSGETAVHCAENQVFDLLLTDVDLPGLNGVDLARQVLEKSPKQAVLFVTGYAALALQATDVLASGARVLSKPFALSDLVAQVEGVLARGLAPPRGSS